MQRSRTKGADPKLPMQRGRDKSRPYDHSGLVLIQGRFDPLNTDIEIALVAADQF
jgi:hypothetical protein